MGELRADAALLGGKARSMASYRTSFAIELLSNLGSTVLDVVTPGPGDYLPLRLPWPVGSEDAA